MPELEFKYSQPQADVILSTYQRTLAMFGQGSGKTHAAGDIAADLSIKFPSIPGFIAANTYMQLSQSTLKGVFRVWREYYGWTKYDAKTNPTGVYVANQKPPPHFNTEGHDLINYHNTIVFEDGALIFTGSLDNFKAHDGKEFGWAILDETKDTKEEALKEVIIARLRVSGMFIVDGEPTDDSDGEPWNPLWVLTSPAKVDWINEFFDLEVHYDEIIEKAHSSTTYFKKETRKGFLTVIASTYHNEDNLPANYIELRKAGVSETTIQMNIYGIPFGKSGGEAYGSFDMNKNVSPTAYNPELPLMLSFDFNVVPYMTLKVFQIYDKEDGSWKVEALPEICPVSPKNNTAATCREFAKAYPNHDAGVFVTGDPSGKSRSTRTEEGRNDYDIIKTELKSYNPQVRVLSKAPNLVPRIQFMNKIFKGETAIEYIEPIENRLTIRDYMYVKEAPNGGKLKVRVKDPDTGQTYEKYGHASDSTEYFFCEFFKSEYKKAGGTKRKMRIA